MEPGEPFERNYQTIQWEKKITAKHLSWKINAMARFIIIIVLGGIVTYGISNIPLNNTVKQGTQNSVDNFSYNYANDIASSMVDKLLMRTANGGTYRVKIQAT